jgi:hypothetical protein
LIGYRGQARLVLVLMLMLMPLSPCAGKQAVRARPDREHG